MAHSPTKAACKGDNSTFGQLQGLVILLLYIWLLTISTRFVCKIYGCNRTQSTGTQPKQAKSRKKHKKLDKFSLYGYFIAILTFNIALLSMLLYGTFCYRKTYLAARYMGRIVAMVYIIAISDMLTIYLGRYDVYIQRLNHFAN